MEKEKDNKPKKGEKFKLNFLGDIFHTTIEDVQLTVKITFRDRNGKPQTLTLGQFKDCICK